MVVDVLDKLLLSQNTGRASAVSANGRFAPGWPREAPSQTKVGQPHNDPAKASYSV